MTFNKNCCAPGLIDCAPGLKYLDTPVIKFLIIAPHFLDSDFSRLTTESLNESLQHSTEKYEHEKQQLVKTNEKMENDLHELRAKLSQERWENVLFFVIFSIYLM